MLDDAKTLVAYLKKSDERGDINFAEDWKLTTLLIGGNDLCNYCKKKHVCRSTVIYTDTICPQKSYSAKKYTRNIMQALDLLQKEVPRMLVQVVAMSNIPPLLKIQTGPTCAMLQAYLCPCGLDTRTAKQMRAVHQQYYQALKRLIEDSGRYDTKKDFTVVLQPFMADQTAPKDKNGKYDPSYFSVDCFHPDRKLHQIMASALWNNMACDHGAHYDNPNASCIFSILLQL
ncbi:hypothetical protein NP493_437g04003 [Ridgeia piscesae]|uniref:Uncharacterized protein n=1 Tax=Ridgeia piscesae TaxID=27915 RepID=A0AAD9KZR5_RIDPI|nr:hypothetical protein NP493_437g04003 [Ridgeia piscesae]